MAGATFVEGRRTAAASNRRPPCHFQAYVGVVPGPKVVVTWRDGTGEPARTGIGALGGQKKITEAHRRRHPFTVAGIATSDSGATAGATK